MNRKPTEGEKKQTKNLILSLAEDLGLILTNLEDIQSRHMSCNDSIENGIAIVADMDIFEYKK